MNKTKVLFLCTGNSARSQMAEALLRKYAGDQFEAYSAGLEPKGINPYTERVMREIGVDISGQYSKHVREYMGKMHYGVLISAPNRNQNKFGYLITVCSDAEAKCPAVFPGVVQRLHWKFEDPAAFIGSEEEILQKFQEVRDEIDKRIRTWLEEQDSEDGLA